MGMHRYLLVPASTGIRSHLGFLELALGVADGAQPALPTFHDGLRERAHRGVTPQGLERAGHLPGSIHLLERPRFKPNIARLLERSRLLPLTLWLLDFKRSLGVCGQDADGESSKSEDETHGDLRIGGSSKALLRRRIRTDGSGGAAVRHPKT
jgi:hypothetical protein